MTVSTVTAPPVPVVLGDHGGPVGGDLGEGEPERPLVARQLEEAGEVAAGRLRAALEDVPGDRGAGQGVVRRRCPAEVRDRRPDDQGCVGDPSGHNHVGASRQRRRDTEATQVGMGRQCSREAQLRSPGAQVVALDVGDRDVDPQAPGDLAHPLGEPGGVEPARVGHDPDPLLEGEAEAVLELADEGARIAERGVLQRVLAEDQHRQLGEVVAGEHVERPTLEHLAHRGQPVAVEPRAVADPEYAGHGGHLSHAAPSPHRAARRSTGRRQATPRRRRRPPPGRRRRGGCAG